MSINSLIEFDDNILKPYYQKIVASLPENKGCEFCQHKYFKNNCNICSFQNHKILTYYVKNCRFFKQKKIIKTW